MNPYVVATATTSSSTTRQVPTARDAEETNAACVSQPLAAARLLSPLHRHSTTEILIANLAATPCTPVLGPRLVAQDL